MIQEFFDQAQVFFDNDIVGIVLKLIEFRSTSAKAIRYDICKIYITFCKIHMENDVPFLI